MNTPQSTSDVALPEGLEDHFLFLYALALSDLHLDPSELEMLYEIGTRRGVNRKRIDSVILNPTGSRPSIPDSIIDRVESLYDFALMVHADGVVEDAESQMLARLCGVFGFENENVEGISSFLLERAASRASVASVLDEVAATI